MNSNTVPIRYIAFLFAFSCVTTTYKSEKCICLVSQSVYLLAVYACIQIFIFYAKVLLEP
jgi:hypothetical protein